MQIISEIPTNYYLVKLTRDEIANLLGYQGIFSEGAKNEINSCIAEGTNIKISAFFENALLFNSIKNSVSYNKATAKLKAMLVALQPIESLFENTDLTELSKNE